MNIMVIIHDEVEYEMNKLVLLKDIKKEKKFKKIVKEKNKLEINNNLHRDYSNFEEKFCGNINIINPELKEAAKIIEKLFLIHNNQPFIDLMNFLYEDYLGTNTSMNFSIVDKNNISHVLISAVDDYREFQYEIYMHACDLNNTALYIKKEQMNDNFKNVVNFQMKKNQYKKACDSENDLTIIKENNNYKLIVLDSDIEIPDLFEISMNQNNKLEKCKVDVLKNWKYDFKRLIESNIYILSPLKIFDLKKRINALTDAGYSHEFLREEIVRFFKEMNLSLDKVKDNGKINELDIEHINMITKQLLELFIKDKTII